jgi:hypothetical protein
VAFELLTSLQAGAQLVTDAISIAREWKAAKGGAPEELERKLQQAQEQLKLAEAAAARDLGYRLCKRHFPPGIMVDESHRDQSGKHVNRLRCQVCDHAVEWTSEGFVSESKVPRWW